jgi:hypothetical protein
MCEHSAHVCVHISTSRVHARLHACIDTALVCANSANRHTNMYTCMPIAAYVDKQLRRQHAQLLLALKPLPASQITNTMRKRAQKQPVKAAHLHIHTWPPQPVLCQAPQQLQLLQAPTSVPTALARRCCCCRCCACRCCRRHACCCCCLARQLLLPLLQPAAVEAALPPGLQALLLLTPPG